MTPQIEMPKYQSHKKVWALKIASAQFDEEDGKLLLTFTDPAYAPLEIMPEDSSRIAKAILSCETKGDTGYFVVYEGGYRSWSPSKEFEEGYSLIQ